MESEATDLIPQQQLARLVELSRSTPPAVEVDGTATRIGRLLVTAFITLGAFLMLTMLFV